MSADRYTSFVSTSFGATLATRLGLPKPAILHRYTPGGPLVSGEALLLGTGSSVGVARDVLSRNDIGVVEQAGTDHRLGAVIVEATDATSTAHLRNVYVGLRDSLKALNSSGRVLVIGRDPDQLADPSAAAVQQGLTGLVRSVGRELRNGATANLIQLRGALPIEPSDSVDNTIEFLLGARSAYIDGQVLRVGAGGGAALPADPGRPLTGKVAVVTGAARGIGAQIARVLARQGAALILVDVPVAGQSLANEANAIGGTAVQLDITAKDAGHRIGAVAARQGGIDIVVHNAGITRDRMLVNMEPARWDSVLEVNLQAQLRLDETFCAPDGPVHDGGRMVSVSSVAGIAGNRGQANYSASKAGVIGMVSAQAKALAPRGITYNAVAPGFIETDMTATIPVALREVSRRLNSLGQGGQPVDVAETVAFLAEPRCAGLTGQVVRVCGQSWLGA